MSVVKIVIARIIYLGNNKTVRPVLIFTLSYILNIVSDNSLKVVCHGKFHIFWSELS